MDREKSYDVVPATTPGILWSALQVGGFSGAAGLGFGGIAGSIRSKVPVIFAVAASLQWFTLGFSYWATRQAVLVEQARRSETEFVDASPTKKSIASALAGGFSGGITAALFRSRANILPGTMMFAAFGYVGQRLVDSRKPRAPVERDSRGVYERFLQSRFNPMRRLPDEEYAEMLKEKLLRVEADIAVIDDDIQRLQKEHGESQDPQA